MFRYFAGSKESKNLAAADLPFSSSSCFWGSVSLTSVVPTSPALTVHVRTTVDWDVNRASQASLAVRNMLTASSAGQSLSTI